MQLPDIDRSSAEAWLSVPVEQLHSLSKALGLYKRDRIMLAQNLAEYFRGEYVHFDQQFDRAQLKEQQRRLSMIRPHPVTLLDLDYSNFSHFPTLPCRIVELCLRGCKLVSLPRLPETLKILRLDKNQLVDLDISYLQLDRLTATCNKLKHVKLCKSLLFLNLCDNRLTHVKLYSKLTHIVLRDNMISAPKIPQTAVW